jgi:hypothetical protein
VQRVRQGKATCLLLPNPGQRLAPVASCFGANCISCEPCRPTIALIVADSYTAAPNRYASQACQPGRWVCSFMPREGIRQKGSLNPFSSRASVDWITSVSCRAPGVAPPDGQSRADEVAKQRRAVHISAEHTSAEWTDGWLLPDHMGPDNMHRPRQSRAASPPLRHRNAYTRAAEPLNGGTCVTFLH